jgi:autotransporter-associated beta strand protein
VKQSHSAEPATAPAWLHAALVVLLAALPVPLYASPAHAATDITGAVRQGQDVTLSGDAVVTLGQDEQVVYGGVFSGVGTLTVAGRGTLVLTANSDFTIPADRQRQRVEPRGEPWWWNTIVDPDPPAVTVESGATLQYGDGEGSTGIIGHYPYDLSNFEWNALNHHVDGTLIVAVHGDHYHPGNLSGSGYIVQPRGTWNGLALAGNHTFSGVLYNGTGTLFSQRQFLTTMPDVDTILNQGSFLIDTQAGNDTVLGMDFYSREWGNNINFHSQIDDSRVIMKGVYSWADSGPDHDPSLSDPDLNFQTVPHNHNKRGTNLEGAKVQWGDGTHNRFFMPGNRNTVYINLHARRERSHLFLNYNGPVTLSAPISGGIFHDTMDAPGAGDVTIMGTAGNDVTFADQQNYDGATTIEAGAVLRLGSGRDGGDAWLLTGTEHYGIRNDGTLVVNNRDRDVELYRINGDGALEQAGSATLTLTGETSYTGATVVSGGTLAITGGDIAASESLRLTEEGAVFDVTGGGDQSVRDLGGVDGSAIRLGDNTLTVDSSADTGFAGEVGGEGGEMVKSGAGVLEFSGASSGASWTVDEGTLALAGAEVNGDLTSAATVAVTEASSLTGTLTVGPESVFEVTGGSGGLILDGEANLEGALRVVLDPEEPLPAEIPVITGGTVDGEFAGLPDGAEFDIDGTAYRVSYEDGVRLTTAPAEVVEPVDEAGEQGGLSLPRSLLIISGMVLALILALGIVMLWLLRRNRREEEADAEGDVGAAV